MKNKHPVLRRFMRRKVSVVAAAVLILFRADCDSRPAGVAG